MFNIRCYIFVIWLRESFPKLVLFLYHFVIISMSVSKTCWVKSDVSMLSHCVWNMVCKDMHNWCYVFRKGYAQFLAFSSYATIFSSDSFCPISEILGISLKYFYLTTFLWKGIKIDTDWFCSYFLCSEPLKSGLNFLSVFEFTFCLASFTSLPLSWVWFIVLFRSDRRHSPQPILG